MPVKLPKLPSASPRFQEKLSRPPPALYRLQIVGKDSGGLGQKVGGPGDHTETPKVGSLDFLSCPTLQRSFHAASWAQKPGSCQDHSKLLGKGGSQASSPLPSLLPGPPPTPSWPWPLPSQHRRSPRSGHFISKLTRVKLKCQTYKLAGYPGKSRIWQE